MNVSSEVISHKILLWSNLIKFSHTIFAMPFALSMLVVVSHRQPIFWKQIFWILIAMITARSAAMAFNRLIDRHIDRLNPRTKDRELPKGALSVKSVVVFFVFSSVVFHFSAFQLSLGCLLLAPVVLGVLCFYSWTKRFTSFAHLVLGIALALAPGGVWYALTNKFSILPIPLMLAVAFWVAGFDIIYSCQDADFDRKQNLYSVPALFGVKKALVFSKLSHLLSAVLLAVFGFMAGLGFVYFIGCIVFSLIIFSQHLLISDTNLSRVNEAFFVRNGFASIVFLVFVFFS
jgi:4-hydroxybenzoate polyprenyltransferase